MQVYLIQEHALPVMSAALVTMGGGAQNPKDKAGLASFTASMVDGGTTSRSSTELANDIAQIGADLTSSASVDNATIRVGALSNNTGAAMDLLADVALHPTFKKEEVERKRSQRLVEIMQEADEPFASAQRVGQKVLYGDRPYGFRPLGTTESVKAATPEDMQQFWTAHYTPKDAALILAGDLTEGQARQLAEKYLGGGTELRLRQRPWFLILRRRCARWSSSTARCSATVLLTFGLGAARSVPEYAALTEMNSILGGLFSSRINMNLREKKAIPTGVFAVCVPSRGRFFYLRTLVRTDVTAPATKELFTELNRIHTDAATPEELKLAKDNALRSLPGSFATVEDEIGLMAELFVYALPKDYFQKLPAQYEQ